METDTFGCLITEVWLLFGLHAAAPDAVRGGIPKPYFPHDDILHI